MLQTSVLTELTKAFRKGVNKTVNGAVIAPDTIFSDPVQIAEILENASQSNTVLPLSEAKNWTVNVPTAPVIGDETTICQYRFDETTGTTADDGSINANDLTIDGATWVEGKFGNCLEFDGTNDVATGDVSSVEPIRNYVYGACWINPDSVTGICPIWNFEDTILVYLDGGVLKATLTFDAGEYTINSGLNVATSSWQYISFQFDNGIVFLALDDIVYKETIVSTTW